MVNRFVLLDRDGTIIEHVHYLSDPEDVKLIAGVVAALEKMSKLGFGLIVLTNQSPIGRSLFSEDRLAEINLRLVNLLREEGVELNAIYYCPHLPEDKCICRKPEVGMVSMAVDQFGFDPKESFVIGDKQCDIELGQRVGATTILVRTGYGAEEEKKLIVPADYVVNDLAEAAQIIEGLVT